MYLGFQGLRALAQALPLPVARAIGRGLGAVAYSLLGSQRRLTQQHLDYALDGSLPVLERRGVAHRVFVNLGQNAMEWLRLPRFSTKRLQRLIHGRGLGERATLMGARSPIEAEFAQASIVVSASAAESFGMTLVEAMRCGVPVVSTDCPLGPAEIIEHGVDGLLVPVDDNEAMAAALLELIGDRPARLRMGEAARASARRFDPAPIARTYEALFADLAAGRRSRRRERHRALWRGRMRRAIRG